ncbi:autophagy-related protein 9A [Leptidea sinapis]|uniref:autophagy-related protein 9A n=1 Tax=Leptidea sinapis TaxID=189913 RepID=UPI00212042E6|nr:autophagy-related protein 9A [Leptidea sinapis]XP_050683996.1 autophagy-related protein 9A [Leptidea sinapis]
MDSRMTHFRRDINYRALQNEIVPPLVVSAGATNAAPTMISLDHDQDDTTNVIIHKVPQTKGGWSHIEDLDSFYTRMYRYYIRGGFYPMMMSDLFYLLQFIFIVWFSTFLVHCVDYPRLFRNDPNANRSEKLSLNDVILSTPDCVACISWQWWCLIVLSAIILFMRLFISIYHLYHAYDIKSFYNSALRLHECDLAWVNWSTIQERVREAQTEHHMCVHKQEIDELDIYHRILRFNNYMVAMVNKNLLPLQIHVPCVGDFHYLSRGLKWNLEFLLFSSPWSPWENCWKLRPQYKDPSKRMILARQLEKQILLLAMVNLVLAPLVQAWQILYFFFNYAELIKRSPGSLGLRTWSLYARVTLRHFNELEHELRDRLNRAHKPATKYLSSFSSPITTVVAKNLVFLSASVLGVLVVLSVYDEDVLTVEHVLTIITVLGCVLAGARALIGDDDNLVCTGPERGEELFVQVLGHVHYLPAAWRGRAHTRDVAAHFQQLFQFRAVYILLEVLSPILCPLVLLSLRNRALDIVDFYRNFTVSVLGIGDVCSFAQLDIRRHGHPDWQTPLKYEKLKGCSAQYNQGEGGKTELSLVAFSCRHPGWSPTEPAQRQFLRSLRQSAHNALPLNDTMNKTMLGSYVQQSIFGVNTPLPAVLSYYQQQKSPYRLPDMDETSDEEEGPTQSVNRPVGLAGTSTALGASAFGMKPATDMPIDEVRDMSVSTLHLYDLHLSQTGPNVSSCCTNNCSDRDPRLNDEATPLLRP